MGFLTGGYGLLGTTGLWIMGYGLKFSANRVGGSEKLWVTGGYGLRGLWDKTVSTVLTRN